MNKLCIKCHKKTRYVRAYDGKELQMCYRCAKNWGKVFEKALLNPVFVRSLDSIISRRV